MPTDTNHDISLNSKPATPDMQTANETRKNKKKSTVASRCCTSMCTRYPLLPITKVAGEPMSTPYHVCCTKSFYAINAFSCRYGGLSQPQGPKTVTRSGSPCTCMRTACTKLALITACIIHTNKTQRYSSHALSITSTVYTVSLILFSDWRHNCCACHCHDQSPQP